MNEVAIFEGFGVWASNYGSKPSRWVNIHEVRDKADGRVEITVNGEPAYLSPDEARRLAHRLYRLARRIEQKINDYA